MAGNLKVPPRMYCNVCMQDDQYLVEASPDGADWRYTCTDASADHPHTWTAPRVTQSAAAEDGIMAELGLFEDLAHCLEPDEPWVEYGIVEHRYRQLRPQTYRDLLDKYGHRVQGGKAYTVSAFLAQGLSRIRFHGVADYRWGKATGAWASNGQVSYWALVPTPGAEGPMTTWKSFAAANDLDPEWSLT